MIQLVKDETSRDPDIDEIAVFAYDRKEDVHGAYTFAKLEWCPNGNWAGVTPEIARLNDRSTYKFNIDIKAKVGDPSGRPSEREFRIYDALEKELLADLNAPEDEVKKKVAARMNITVEELQKSWFKVFSYNSGLN